MKIVFATRNKKKLEELRRMLQGINNIELLGLDSFPHCPEVEETGTTFEENSRLKAVAIARCTGLWALADDSGLEVDALHGAPGVYSARYAGEGANDQKNVEKLLRALEGVPAGQRTARFRAVITLAGPEGDEKNIKAFEGAAEGAIGTAPEGENGFGYDPVFYPEGHGRTFAQMPPAEKDSMSHRGKALEKLKEYLRSSVKG